MISDIKWVFTPYKKDFLEFNYLQYMEILLNLLFVPFLRFLHWHPFASFFVMYLVKFWGLLKFLKALGLYVVSMDAPFGDC